MFYQFTIIFIGSFSQLAFASNDRDQPAPTNHCYSIDDKRTEINYYSFATPHPLFSKQLNYTIEGCEPEKIWLLIRHGTRYSDAAPFKTIQEMLPQVQHLMSKTNELCQHDYNQITNWKINELRNPSGLVWPQGWTDLHELAQSFKDIYPTLFDAPYSPESYSFSHSSVQRTIDSCKAFTEKLFGHKTMKDSQKYWSTNDTVLIPFNFCSQMQDYVSSFYSSNNEMYLFEASTHLEEVRRNVSRRLGMNNFTLNFAAIASMWNECKNQQDYHWNTLSPWCAAFTVDEAIALEYVDDLGFYHTFSYGNPLASVLPCTLIKSMLETTTSTSSNRVTANFAHAETLALLITALGIKHDSQPLLASNFKEQTNRQFKVSKLMPYASNFAAVTYNCSSLGRASSSSTSTSSNQSSTENEESKVLMLLNQEPIEMPWCEGGAICTIDEMSRMFYTSGMRNCPYGICGDSFANPEDT